jgi:hypothetical protein
LGLLPWTLSIIMPTLQLAATVTQLNSVKLWMRGVTFVAAAHLGLIGWKAGKAARAASQFAVALPVIPGDLASAHSFACGEGSLREPPLTLEGH